MRAMKEYCLYHGRDSVHDLSAKLSQCPCDHRCCPAWKWIYCLHVWWPVMYLWSWTTIRANRATCSILSAQAHQWSICLVLEITKQNSITEIQLEQALGKPHTSGTALSIPCVCLFACLLGPTNVHMHFSQLKVRVKGYYQTALPVWKKAEVNHTATYIL